ncbi:MAG: class I SAM-dependent methyltransferase [Lachnospiraceae bacterium]|nr:class I SAM-dependent methyltransferase [Lachnospiraceae bacterium]
MKNIAIYGIGKHFNSFVVQNKFIKDKLFKNYTIIGLIDQNKCGQEFILNDKKYTILALAQWTDFDIDKVVVTTGKYFEEICNLLQQHGFKQEQICLLDELVRKFFNEFIQIECYRGKNGLEIGGPSSVFSVIYDVCKSCDGVNFSEDTVWWNGKAANQYLYKDLQLGRIIIADATDLSAIADNTYDFVLSSNNLEHIANPMKAMEEFYRVLKKDGIILIVVPNKEVTFDHDREYTTFEHILKDYQNNIGEDDLTHLPEIIKRHDYDMDIACGGAEAFRARADKNVENRCLHHHVFNERCLKSLFDYFHIDIAGVTKMYTNYWIVGKK